MSRLSCARLVSHSPPTGVFSHSARIVIASLAAALAACGPGARPTAVPVATAAPADTAPARSAPIAVRVLIVTWAGAARAPAEVTRTRAQAEARAATVAQMVREPDADVGEIAREFADLPTTPTARGAAVVVVRDDGSPGAEIRRREFVATVGPESIAVVEAEAFRLRMGEASDPIGTAGGFVILVRAADPPARPAQIGARHLLVMYRGSERAPASITRTKEEALVRATEALRRARAGEDWVALVREYTDEAGAPEGGDLGVFGHGAMVPAFERAAFSLDIGGVSEVVESPFGYHVIQRYQ